MRKALFARRLCAAAACLWAALPCGAQAPQAPAATVAPLSVQSQRLPAFSKLQLDGAMDLQLMAHGEAVLELPSGGVRAWVDGDTLHLMSPVSGTVASELGLSARPRVRLQQPAEQLQSIELRGSSQVQIGTLQAGRLKLLLSGSGGLRVERVEVGHLDLLVHGSGSLQLGQVQARRLAINLTGSGSVQVGALQSEQLEARLRASGGVSIEAGRAREQEWLLSGSGDVRAAGLQGERVKLRGFGSGDADLGAMEQLQLSIYGSGDVSYAGQPALQLWMPGSGSVRARGEAKPGQTLLARP